MSPVWMYQGNRFKDPVSERNLAERRFAALAAAVRQHEGTSRRELTRLRPCDRALYRRLRQILGEAAVP